ncbi:heavy metal translocating P-type ATPase [soil metagenome]
MDKCCDLPPKKSPRTHDRPQSPVADVPRSGTAVRFRIEKMDCPTEETLIRKKLESMPGVQGLDFNLLEREITVHHSLPGTETLTSALTAIGMAPVEIGTDAPDQSAPRGMEGREKLLLWIGGIAALAAEVLGWSTGKETSWPVAALSLLSILTTGLPTLHKGWIAVRSFTLNINFLMSLAVIGAVAIQRWPEAAMVTFLFAIAEAIEKLSLENARNAIRALSELAPDTAEVWDNSGWVERSVREVSVNERIRLRTGLRVPLDSRLESGNIAVNEAPITGESLPVDKVSGDPLFAGTIVLDGTAEAIVTAVAGASTLAKIAGAVQEAQKQRAPTQRFVDVFSRYYTPSVFVLALLVVVIGSLFASGGFSRWLYEGLVILVIACPCALVISTPVSIVSGLAAAAKRGILIKGGVYLEGGEKLRIIAVDKTGTLTLGKPALTDFILLNKDYDKDALLIAASLDEQSTHPIAQAVVKAFRNEDADAKFFVVTNFKVLQGRGVSGEITGQTWHLGNHRLIEELRACSKELETTLHQLEDAGKTALILTGPDGPIAAFGIADVIRPESRDAVQTLQQQGIQVVMLTGDNNVTAMAVARQVGITDARGELLPEDKATAVAELRERFGPIGMVGDGINDAPGLARADIGFAMGAAGTAAAMETADVAIMDDDLRKVAKFVRLSHQTKRVLRQNITLALAIKAVFLVLALSQHATLWMAILADMGGSLLVVFNGLRLTRS